jgi:hypothetical protein
VKLDAILVERHGTCLGNASRRRKTLEEEKHTFLKHVEAEATEGGKNLVMRKFLLKTKKEVEEPVQ